MWVDVGVGGGKWGGMDVLMVLIHTHACVSLVSKVLCVKQVSRGMGVSVGECRGGWGEWARGGCVDGANTYRCLCTPGFQGAMYQNIK